LSLCGLPRKEFMDGMKSSADSVINVGIIGAGYGLTNLLPVLTSMPEYRVVFFGTQSGLKPDLEFEQPFLKDITFTTPKELISNGDIALVVIASPPLTHEGYAIAALEAGKNIYCEKPVGLNANSTERILQASKETKLISTVGYQFRFDPMIQWLKDRIDSGEIGKISRVKIRWETSGASKAASTSWRNQLNLGGGVLRDFGSHVFDYLSFIGLVNSSWIFDELEGFGRVRSNTSSQDIQDINFSCMFGSIELHCVISRTRSQPIGHDIRIFGSNAEVHVSHKPPFGIKDLKLEIVTKSEPHKNMGQNKNHAPNSAGFSMQNLDGRQLSAKRLFAELAHTIKVGASEKLPTLQQALLNQNLVDEVASVLFYN
jgi:predicted dehydrogenase